MLWPGKKLEVADGADLRPLMKAIFGGKQEKVSSAEAVHWALSRLREKRAQVLIRLYGLDGGGERNIQAICREVNFQGVIVVSDTTIYNNRNRGLQQLRDLEILQVLLGQKPVPR
ncbi:MAG: hypothetical protein Q8O75_03875 [bacterium]|nr:hypothetical protein [bacterium]